MPWLRRDGFAVGFSAALGTAVLLGFLYLGWRFVEAALSIATPFVVAFAVAQILAPLVDRVQHNVRLLRGQRMPAVLLIYLLFLLVFGALFAYLVPLLIQQATDLAREFPQYVQNVRTLANDYLHTHRSIGPFHLPKNIETITAQYSDQLDQALKLTASRLARIIIGSVSGLLTVVLVPIITFYLLADMHRLRARFLFLLPERFRTPAQRAASDVGEVFGNYIRGMVIVSSAYGVVAMLIFFGFGLRSYALLLGFAAGVLYAVPYVGPFVTAFLAAVVSLATGHSMGMTALLLAAVLAENQAFDNVVVPRVVGDSVGLHPLMTLFALFLGGELFGLWGMLLSVPVAASIQQVAFRLFPKLREPTPLHLAMPFEGKVSTAHETIVRDAVKAEAAATDTP